MEKFRTALLGYSKRDVCEFISKFSDELTAKHAGVSKELENKIEQLREENARLSAENKFLSETAEALRAENKQATDDTARVSEILMDARQFADEIRNKAIVQNQIEMEENAIRQARVAEKIKKCANEVDTIRGFLRRVLEKTDGELVQIQERLEVLDGIKET